MNDAIKLSQVINNQLTVQNEGKPSDVVCIPRTLFNSFLEMQKQHQAMMSRLAKQELDSNIRGLRADMVIIDEVEDEDNQFS